jgi:hypothetical protein
VMPLRGACRCRAGRDEIRPPHPSVAEDSVDDVEGASHAMRHSHQTTAVVRGAEPPRS